MRIWGGMLQLTLADFQQTGSALIDVPDIGAMTEFVADFDVYMGGGAVGGEGISFNMGADMPQTYFDERGAGDGLSVLLLSGEGLVEVWFMGALWAWSNRSLSLSMDEFVPVRIAYTEEGLSVAHNNVTLLEGVMLAGWSPAPSWVVVAGSSHSAARRGVRAHRLARQPHQPRREGGAAADVGGRRPGGRRKARATRPSPAGSAA